MSVLFERRCSPRCRNARRISPPCRGATISIRSPSLSGVASRARAGTNSPLSAVATVALVEFERVESAPRAWRPRSRCGSPLTTSFIMHPRRARRERQRRRALGERRREQEAVAVEAVDEDAAAALVDARLIVRIGGAHVGAHLEDLGLAKRRMKRVGRAQQFQRRAHGDRALLRAFDHRRADHVFAVRRAARCRAGCADAGSAPRRESVTSGERMTSISPARRGGR